MPAWPWGQSLGLLCHTDVCHTGSGFMPSARLPGSSQGWEGSTMPCCSCVPSCCCSSTGHAAHQLPSLAGAAPLHSSPAPGSLQCPCLTNAARKPTWERGSNYSCLNWNLLIQPERTGHSLAPCRSSTFARAAPGDHSIRVGGQLWSWAAWRGPASSHTTCRLRSCPSSCTLSLCSSSISRLWRSVLWRTSER